MMILIVPALQLMLTGSPWQFALGQVLMAVTDRHGARNAGRDAGGDFSLRTRVTSMSFAYSVTLALAGGTRAAGIRLAGATTADSRWHPPWYIMGYGVVGLTLLWSMKETNTRALERLSETPGQQARTRDHSRRRPSSVGFHHVQSIRR